MDSWGFMGRIVTIHCYDMLLYDHNRFNCYIML